MTEKSTETLQLSIGNHIKEIRKLKGLRQKDLAESLGVTPMMVSLWEAGKRNIDIKTRTELLDVLGIEGSFPLSGKDKIIKNISETLVQEREKMGKSKSWVAKQIGVTRQAYGNWENGVDLPTTENFKKIENVFGWSEGQLQRIADSVVRNNLIIFEALLSEYLSLHGLTTK